jgi:hypothetical protein
MVFKLQMESSVLADNRVVRIGTQKILFDDVLDKEPRNSQAENEDISGAISPKHNTQKTEGNPGINRMAHMAICAAGYDLALRRDKANVSSKAAPVNAGIGSMVPQVSGAADSLVSTSIDPTLK